jgi:hypothetical protein
MNEPIHGKWRPPASPIKTLNFTPPSPSLPLSFLPQLPPLFHLFFVRAVMEATAKTANQPSAATEMSELVV